MTASPNVDTDTRDRLLRRIGLSSVPAADADGLRAVHRAFVATVPFEDLTVQLGESESLEPGRLVERILQGGRGGYCFEANTVLLTLLESLGFEVERREAVVGPRGLHAKGAPTDHLTLVVGTSDGERFVAEGGFGEGPVEPLPLAEGSVTVGEFTFVLERDGDGWWLDQHEHGSAPGFHFGDAPASLADFAPHHERMSASPDSQFVKTLLVQQPHADRIVSLRARTFFVDGPGRRERALIADEDAFAATLRDAFGIDPSALGPDRLARLWARAEEQHAAHRQPSAD